MSQPPQEARRMTDPLVHPQPSEEATRDAVRLRIEAERLADRLACCAMPGEHHAFAHHREASVSMIHGVLLRVSAQALERAAKEVEKFGGPLNVYSDVAASVRALKPGGK